MIYTIGICLASLISEGAGRREFDEAAMKTRIAAALIALFTLEAAPPSPDEIFGLGMKALEARDWDRALSLLETALAAEPNNLRYGSEYRQAALTRATALHPKEGAVADFDRPLSFLEKLTKDNPSAENAWLNYGFAYVDKIPAAGSITQVIMANNALTRFTKSIELKPTWLALYTRGNSYLYWPKIFGRTSLGVADLEKALAIQKSEPRTSVHVRVFITLGDGYWKSDNPDKAQAIWKDGLKEFPDSRELKDRLSRQGDDLAAYINAVLDPNKRVDTNLRELWGN